MDSQQERLDLFVFLAWGVTLSILLFISILNSPQAHFFQTDSKSAENAIYQNIGTATKSMFFHELKKRKP